MFYIEPRGERSEGIPVCSVDPHFASFFLGPLFLYHLSPVLIPIKLAYPAASDSLRRLD